MLRLIDLPWCREFAVRLLHNERLSEILSTEVIPLEQGRDIRLTDVSGGGDEEHSELAVEGGVGRHARALR